MTRAEDLFRDILVRGMDAIDDLIKSEASEELFLDFKRAVTNSDDKTLRDEDRKNLSKAISGFGNSEGGIIVWGVSTSKDKAKGDVADCKIYVKNVKKFVSLIEGAVSGCSIPPHSDTRSISIEREGTAEGIAVTFIGKSNYAPHQDVLTYKYYIRSGSSFQPALHSVIAGMFGKRPQPSISLDLKLNGAGFQNDRITFKLEASLRNNGAVMANDVYINFDSISSSKGVNISYMCHNRSMSTSNLHSNNFFAILKDEHKLPPLAKLGPIDIFFEIYVQDISALSLNVVYGCDNSPVNTFKINASREHLRKEAPTLIQHLQKGYRRIVDITRFLDVAGAIDGDALSVGKNNSIR